MYGTAVVIVGLAVAVYAMPEHFFTVEEEMPQSCVGKNYCFEKSINYPQKLIDNILIRSGYKVIEGQGDNELGNRDSDGLAEHDCDRKIDFEPIYEVIDKQGRLRFVVQSDILQQKIRTESCVKPGRITSTHYFENSRMDVLNVTCVEKRIEYTFLALTLDGKDVEDVDVMGGLPVCCSCQIYVPNFE